MAALPYKNSEQGKKKQVEEMFNNISSKYDLLNHLLSANIDKKWRKKAVKRLSEFSPATVLDVATGTADFALEVARLKPDTIVGVDISEGMLAIGREKVRKKGLTGIIELVKADSEELPFADSTFDAAVVGFGVRNFENLEKGLAEIFRVLKPGAVFIVLEFSRPLRAPFRQLYFFYFKQLLPLMGRIISKDKNAYSYLPESVMEFPDGENFVAIMKKTGFTGCFFEPQTFGISSIYQGQKPKK